MPDRALQEMENQRDRGGQFRGNLEEKKKMKSDEQQVAQNKENQHSRPDTLPVPTATRQRSESEDSNSSEDRASSLPSDTKKRQRTHSSSSPGRGFVIPGVAASPPKFVSLEEIMKAANGVSNMALAHEIAVDKDFKLEKLDPPENSLVKRVRETMKKAFWDILAEQLSQTPPNYTQAMVLLEDVKENLLALLLPHHTKTRSEISEVLDVELIRQQAVAGVLDFQHYAQYVVSTMAKLCAPVRDEKIRELTQDLGVVSVFKGILETLDLMKLDMANFTIQQIRPHIIAQSVEYEKTKFAEFLETQEDGLEMTRKWLKRHASNVDNSSDQRAMVFKVLTDAYMELLDWDDKNIFPETLVMDHSRFLDLREQVRRMSVIGAILLVAMSSVGAALQGVQGFKDRLKNHIKLLLEDEQSDEDLVKLLPNVAVQIIRDVNDGLEEAGSARLAKNVEKLLAGQIQEVARSDHRIRQLVKSRILEFFQRLITSATAAPLQVPPGLSSLQAELAGAAGQFLRLVSHNRSVFLDYYADIVAAARQP